MITKIWKNRIQIFYFALVGVICACIEIILMKILSLPSSLPSIFTIENAKNDYPLSNFLSTGVSILINYYLSIWLVFEQGKHSKHKEILFFIGLSIISLFVSWRLFAFYYNFINKPIDLGFYVIGPIVLSKILAILTMSIINYIIKKKFIFDN